MLTIIAAAKPVLSHYTIQVVRDGELLVASEWEGSTVGEFWDFIEGALEDFEGEPFTLVTYPEDPANFGRQILSVLNDKRGKKEC